MTALALVPTPPGLPANASVAFTSPGTNRLSRWWGDAAGTTLAANPTVTDASGNLPTLYAEPGPRTILLPDSTLVKVEVGPPADFTALSIAGDIAAVSATVSPTAAHILAAIPPGTYAQGLIPTAVKTAPYAAAPKDYVLTDATAGSVDHPLPVAPPDQTRIGYKMVATSGTNVTTFTCGGSDHINLPTGPTVGTLTYANQAVVLQYAAATATYIVQSSDLPASAVVDRSTANTKVGSLTLRDMLYLRPATTLSQITAKPPGSGVDSPIELVHQDNQAYIFHLICGASMGDKFSGASLIGMGIDNGGRGLFVNNKKTGVGIWITQNDTITDAQAYGLVVSQGSTIAPAAWFGQGLAGVAPAAIFTSNVVAAVGQKLVKFQRTVTTSSDTDIGWIASDTGSLVWNDGIIASTGLSTSLVPLVVQSGNTSTANLATFTRLGGGGTVTITKDGAITATATLTATGVLASATGAFVAFLDSGGTVDQRRWSLSQNSGTLLIGLKTDAGASVRNPLALTGSNGNVAVLDGAALVLGTSAGSGFKIGSAANQKLGFYNTTPIVQPSSTAAASTDLASVITLANDLRTKLLALGLVA